MLRSMETLLPLVVGLVMGFAVSYLVIRGKIAAVLRSPANPEIDGTQANRMRLVMSTAYLIGLREGHRRAVAGKSEEPAGIDHAGLWEEVGRMITSLPNAEYVQAGGWGGASPLKP